jgi:hypothetical protein
MAQIFKNFQNDLEKTGVKKSAKAATSIQYVQCNQEV